MIVGYMYMISNNWGRVIIYIPIDEHDDVYYIIGTMRII